MIQILLRQRWILFALACFIGLFAIFVYDTHRTPTAVQYLNHNNIPADIDQLKSMYPEATESENGIFLLLKAESSIEDPCCDHYDNLPFGGGSEVEFGKPLTIEQHNALQQYVDMHEEVSALIFEALNYPYVRLPHDRYDIEVNFLSELRAISRYLYTVAIYAAVENDIARSFEATKANFAVTEISIYGNDFISELTRVAALGLAVESIEQALCYATLPPLMIKTYMELLAIEEESILANHQNALKTDCALDLSSQRYHGRYFEKTLERFNTSLLLGRIAREYNQLAFFAERMYIKELEETLNLGNQDIYAKLSLPSRDSTEKIYCGLRQIYLFSFGTYTVPAQYIATVAAARTALAALLFYYDHGYMPGTLDVLTPEYLDTLPRDPFTPDQPIRFRVDGDIARFYSIGRNEVDNDGITRTYNHDEFIYEKRDCDDIVFRLKVPQGDIPLTPPSKGEL